MSKYEPLGKFLREQSRDRIPMTFAGIERLLNGGLPPSKRHRAWWSNNSSNNVMTRQWLEAGYVTEAVDIAGEKLVFRRVSGIRPGRRPVGQPQPIFGCMKGLFTLADGFDPTVPMDLERRWDRKYQSGR